MAQARTLGWSFLLLLFTASPSASPIGSVFKIHLELTPFYQLHHHQSGPSHLHFSCGSSPSLLNWKPCFCLVAPPSLVKSLPSIAARKSLLKCQIMWPPCSKPSGGSHMQVKAKSLLCPTKHQVISPLPLPSLLWRHPLLPSVHSASFIFLAYAKQTSASGLLHLLKYFLECSFLG